jgi:signal transduction histidine kinase
MGGELQSVMMKWHMDFYAEFSAICVALQVGPDSGARDDWDDFLQRYEEWSRAPSNPASIENIYTNPDLVRSVYIWETSRQSNPQLLHLNWRAGKIETASVPPDLKALLAHLQQNSMSLQAALHAWASDDSTRKERLQSAEPTAPTYRLGRGVTTGWQFDEEIPAVVHPILHRTRHGSVHAKAPTNLDPVDWIVIVLNLDTVKNRIFPELARRYFSSGHDLEYKVAIAAIGKRPRLLYSSDPEFGVKDVTGSDSVMNIFGPPSAGTEDILSQTVKNREPVRGDEWRSFSGPVWFPVIQETSESGPWMLFVRHRKAPLEATITSVWRANLISGGVVLILLATSVVLVVIASQRAQGLASMQMGFVASISHELRTPLAAIFAAGQNLTDGFARDHSQYGSIITTQARQLINLVDQILLFAAMKDRKQKYHLAPVQMGEVLTGLRQTTLAMLEQSGFDVDFRVQEKLPCVFADQQALLRCLQNLVDNAAKYSGDSRWVGVCAELHESASHGKQIKISVADHGMGISSSELERIFEPFYRGPRAIAAQIHGTGLGLSIVRHIVTAMGGSMSVTSQVGLGSVFVLHLPVAVVPDPVALQEPLISR